MKMLLVPVDGSENAQRAMKHAVTMAKASGAALHLLYVCEDYPDADRAHAFRSKAELEKPGRERGEEILKREEALAKADGVPVSMEVVFGDTAPAIVRRAEELGADGIVMGTRGLGSLANLLLGSTATKVVHTTTLPVTLVK